MYISVFWWGQGRREIIFRMWKQKPLRVIAEKKTVLNAVNHGGVYHLGDVFDVGYVPFERSPEATISAQPPPER